MEFTILRDENQPEPAMVVKAGGAIASGIDAGQIDGPAAVHESRAGRPVAAGG